MIIKFEKYNESIKSLLIGPTKEEVWKSFGYDRTFDTIDEFFEYIIKDMKRFPQTKYPDYIFWGKNNMIIFEQYTKNDNLLFINHKVLGVIKSIFDPTYYQQTVVELVEKYLHWDQYTPFKIFSSRALGWKELR